MSIKLEKNMFNGNLMILSCFIGTELFQDKSCQMRLIYTFADLDLVSKVYQHRLCCHFSRLSFHFY